VAAGLAAVVVNEAVTAAVAETVIRSPLTRSPHASLEKAKIDRERLIHGFERFLATMPFGGTEELRGLLEFMRNPPPPKHPFHGERAVIEEKWQINERRLNEIVAMSGVGRETHTAESERLESEQDAIEFELGFEVHHRSQKRSGAR
jgi:hypothetical protein